MNQVVNNIGLSSLPIHAEEISFYQFHQLIFFDKVVSINADVDQFRPDFWQHMTNSRFASVTLDDQSIAVYINEPGTIVWNIIADNLPF